MNKIEERLIDTLNRINFAYNNGEIKMECVKNFEGFSLFGKRFGPFEIGKKYKLKLFLALLFIKNNILIVAPSEKCDNFDVQRIAITERDDLRLIRQENNNFLNKLREFKKFMQKDVREGVRTNMDLDKYISYMSNIIDSRLLKLLRLSRIQLSLDDERRLTNSEKELFTRINNQINIFKTFFLKDIKEKNN